MNTSQFVSRRRLLFSTSLILISCYVSFAQYQGLFTRHGFNFDAAEGVEAKLRTRPRIYEATKAEKSESASKPEKERVSTSVLEKLAFDLLNQKRMELGLKPTIWSDDAARVARLHSIDMAQHNYFSHIGLDGLTVDARADAAGLKNWKRIGENIAYNRGYDDPIASAVSRWMRSEAHRQNLLNAKWIESGIGIALAADGKTYYVTQVFVRRK